MARLFIGKNYGKGSSPVQSVFRLAGRDEDALTYALGYLLALDPVFCKAVLGSFRLAPWKHFASGYSVRLQEVTGTGFGRRDIVIEGSDARVVIEAKIGDAEPDREQLLKYGSESKLWGVYKARGIVALTQGKLSEAKCGEVRHELCKKRIQFSNVQWHQIVDLALSHKPSDDSGVTRYLFDEFIRFIRSDYRMNYYDAEVLIQDVNSENEAVYKEHWMYLGTTKDKKVPLYFAPYFIRQEPKGITSISRVIDTHVAKPVCVDKVEDVANPPSEEHRARWSAGLSKLSNWDLPDLPGGVSFRLFFLDEPIKFRETPLTKKAFRETRPAKRIPPTIPKGFSLRFDELLRASALIGDSQTGTSPQ